MNRCQILLALPLALSAGCSSNRAEGEPPLPFHVAIAPIVVDRGLKWQHGDTEPALEDQKFQLEIPAEAVRKLEQRLQAELSARSFVRVTALPPADADGAGDVERALDARADLLLECHLKYNPAVVFEVDGTFALNIPVWLFLGPVSWAVQDCDYVVSAQLTAEFFDLGELEGRPGDALNAPTRLLTVTPGFESTDLDFIARNGSAVYKYLPLIVVPPGFLFRGSELTREKVVRDVFEVLVAGLTDSVRQRSEDLVQESQRQRGAFYLDPRKVQLDPLPGGGRRLRCELVLRPSAGVEELHDLTVEDVDGAVLLETSLVDLTPLVEADAVRYMLDLELTPPPETRYLVLVVTDQNRRRRSFTVALPDETEARQRGI